MDRLDTLFQQFLRERIYLKNVTPKPQVWYESAWNAFKTARAGAPDRPPPFPLISRSDLSDFIVHLRDRGVKPVSCNTWLRALNAFCRWLHEQGDVWLAARDQIECSSSSRTTYLLNVATSPLGAQCSARRKDR
jgi:hypothetical protein